MAGVGVDRGSGSSPGGVADLASDTGSTLVGYTPTTGVLAGVVHTVASFLDKIGNAGTNLGAALIGFVQSGIGALPRTVQGKERDIYSVLDWIPEALHASIKTATNATALDTYIDNAEAALDALTQSSTLYFPEGAYLRTTVQPLHARFEIEGAGRLNSYFSYGAAYTG